MRRRAGQAARDKDSPELILLTTPYFGHQGGSGVLTTPKTVKAYQLDTRQFLEYAEAHAVSLLKPGRHDGQNYVNHMIGARRAPARAQLKVAGAGCLYRALRWAGAAEADPFRDVKIPKDLTPGIMKRPPYTEDSLAEVLDHADPHEMFLLYHAGLRISDPRMLKWDDLEEITRHLHCSNTVDKSFRLFLGFGELDGER